MDLYDRGMREPLPLPLRTGHAWAEAVHAHRDADRALAGAWESTDSSPVPGEQDDPAHVRVYGRRAPVGCLLEPARPDESWSNGRAARSAPGSGQLALRLWEPLLSRERVSQA